MTGTIMIVDDHPDNLRVLKSVLGAQGYVVRPADSGRVALRALQRAEVDLILLDIRMPEMDGYEVCQALKADPHTAGIPVIFLSALDSPIDKVKAFEAGGVDYVSKPFNEQEVLARVATHLRLHRLEGELRRHNEELEGLVAERTRDLQRSNEALVATNSALEQALRAKNEFLMLMNHEFRTPLNGILGLTGLVRPGLGERQASYIDIIEASGWRLLNMVDDILQLTRRSVAPSARGDTAAPLDIHALCTESVATLAALAARKHIEIELETGELPRLEMPMDAPRLRQVLGNLLDNAVKFTPEGGRVGVGVAFSQDSRVVLLNVWDTGPGIPPEQRERIFEPFVQLDAVSTRSHSGPGLGLSLARNLVELHGGTLKVSERPGGGSVFRVQLPVTRALVQTSAPPTPAPEGRSTPPSEAHLSAEQEAELIAALDQGNLAQVGEIAVRFIDEGCCVELAREIHALARHFDIAGIRRLVRR